jgi:hypothetical protein
MNKVRQFRQRAQECRELALKAATVELRGHYEDLARTWEKLAEERRVFFVETSDARDEVRFAKRR